MLGEIRGRQRGNFGQRNLKNKNPPAVQKGKDCSVSIRSRGCNLPAILIVKEILLSDGRLN